MDNMKNLLLTLFVFIGLQAFSQNPVSTRQLRLTTIPAANASDTAAIVANRGRIWYDFNTNQVRVNRNGVNGSLGSGSGGGGGLSTASNGLTATGSNVELGGALTGNTTVSGAFDLQFTNTSVTFNNSGLNIFNPARTFRYTVVSSGIVGNRTITLPALTASATFMLNASPLVNAIPFYANAATMSTNSGFTFNGTTFTTPNVQSNGNISLTGFISSTQPTNGGGNFVATTNFAGGADPSLTMTQHAANTTNATPTNLVSNAVPLFEGTIMMKGLLHAYRTGGSGGTNGDCAFYEIQYLFNTVSGNTNIVNGSVTVVGESNAAWNCTVSVSGGTVIEINVTGSANNNITWQMVKLETSIIQ